jgi:hypothetical protein
MESMATSGFDWIRLECKPNTSVIVCRFGNPLIKTYKFYRVLRTRFKARNCISELGPQEP